jgi:hypothetical protein
MASSRTLLEEESGNSLGQTILLERTYPQNCCHANDTYIVYGIDVDANIAAALSFTA